MTTPRSHFRLRPTLVWLHRWVGLTLGLVFAIVSLSGSLLFFQDQFFSWAHGAMIPDALPSRVGSLDRWVENARKVVPGLRGPIAIWAPHVDHNVSDAGMLVFTGTEPGGLGNMGMMGVLVVPGNGDVLGVVDIDRSPAYAPLFLHRDLWAGATGRIVSGVMAVGTLFLLVAGLWLWWPARLTALGKKLSPRPWRGTFLQAARLHDWVGVWTLVVLFVLTVSGLHLVQPSWLEPVLHELPGAEADHHEAVPPVCTGPALGFDAAVAAAQALVPSGRMVRLFPHDAALRQWEIGFQAADSDAMQHETHVAVDLQCGTAAIESSPARRTPHDAAGLWLAGLHDGTAFGTGGRVAVTIAGLAPVVLAWSGISMWLRKRRALAAKRRAVPGDQEWAGAPSGSLAGSRSPLASNPQSAGSEITFRSSRS